MCNIDFSGFITIPNYGLMILCIVFYLKLPQTTVAMTDSHNVAYNLTTWHGIADLMTLTSNEVRTLILEPCLQDGPIALHPANFNLGDANIDTVTVRKRFMQRFFAWGSSKSVCQSLRNYVQGIVISPMPSWSTFVRLLLALTVSR
jgi:hypothetical protein